MHAFGHARSRASLTTWVPGTLAAGDVGGADGPVGLRDSLVRTRLYAPRSWSTVFLIGVPVGLLVSAVIGNLGRSDGLGDFRIYRLAGRAVLHGQSPYMSPQSILAHGSGGFVYPAPAAWAMVPFSLLPFTLAALCFTVLTVGAVIGSLWLLGVRDLRCFGVALLMMPVSTAITTGTVSTLLTCAAALVWRYRDRVVLPAVALAGSLMLKPLLWPVAIWLAATRRWRAAGLTLLVTAVGMTAAYAALQINGLESYPALVKATTAVEGGVSYSLYGLLSQLGAPFPLVASYLIGAALLVAVWVVRRDECLSFVIAIAATLALTPIVWVHYFSLLLIPLALGSRRLTWWWSLPAVVWLVQGGPSPASPVNATLVWWLALLTLACYRLRDTPFRGTARRRAAEFPGLRLPEGL